MHIFIRTLNSVVHPIIIYASTTLYFHQTLLKSVNGQDFGGPFGPPPFPDPNEGGFFGGGFRPPGQQPFNPGFLPPPENQFGVTPALPFGNIGGGFFNTRFPPPGGFMGGGTNNNNNPNVVGINSNFNNQGFGGGPRPVSIFTTTLRPAIVTPIRQTLVQQPLKRTTVSTVLTQVLSPAPGFPTSSDGQKPPKSQLIPKEILELKDYLTNNISVQFQSILEAINRIEKVINATEVKPDLKENQSPGENKKDESYNATTTLMDTEEFSETTQIINTTQDSTKPKITTPSFLVITNDDITSQPTTVGNPIPVLSTIDIDKITPNGDEPFIFLPSDTKSANISSIRNKSTTNDNKTIIITKSHSIKMETNIARSLQNLSAFPELLAYYPFDQNFKNQIIFNNSEEIPGGRAKIDTKDRISGNGSLYLDGQSYLILNQLRNHKWGKQFSISLWFKREGLFNNYASIISNGYADKGSWDIRMGRELQGQRLGAGIITKLKKVESMAKNFEWHHVLLTYNGKELYFYLDGEKQHGNVYCCKGNVKSNNNPITIGKAGYGGYGENFMGHIDELLIFRAYVNETIVKQLNSLKYLAV